MEIEKRGRFLWVPVAVEAAPGGKALRRKPGETARAARPAPHQRRSHLPPSNPGSPQGRLDRIQLRPSNPNLGRECSVAAEPLPQENIGHQSALQTPGYRSRRTQTSMEGARRTYHLSAGPFTIQDICGSVNAQEELGSPVPAVRPARVRSRKVPNRCRLGGSYPTKSDLSSR